MQNNFSSDPMTFNEHAETLDLGQYWRTIKRAKWLIAAFTLGCMAIGIYKASTATPIYQASSKILADPQQPNAAREEQYIASALVFLFYETQYEIIRSRAIAQTVVEKLNLVEQYREEQKASSAQAQPSGLLPTLGELKQEVMILLGKPQTDRVETPKTDDEIKVMLASNIQSGIKVSGGKQSQIINISYQSDDPQLATDIINALGEAYIQFGLESRLGEVKNTENWLSEQSVDLKNQLTDSENKLRNFRLQQGIVDTNLQQTYVNLIVF